MRTCLILIFVFLFLVPVGIPLLILEWILGKFRPDLRDKSSLRIVQGVFSVILFLAGVKVTVIGRENIPKDRPVLYISNHRSYFDVIIGYRLVNGLCGFLSKQEIGKIPLLRTWMLRLHCLFLNRANAKEGLKTILAAIAQVKSGISVWICPEGTRNREPGLLPFKEGSFRVAEKSGCPVVPVAFTHTDEILEQHFPWVHRAAVTVEFGEPIETAGMSREEKKGLAALAQSRVEEMYKKNY